MVSSRAFQLASIKSRMPYFKRFSVGYFFLVFNKHRVSLACCAFVQIPHSLFRESGYDHREALFGVPPYGGSIAQNLYYANSDLCDPNVDTRGGFPQRENDSSGKMAPWPSPYILMVDRGGCTFVKKVRCRSFRSSVSFRSTYLTEQYSCALSILGSERPALGCGWCNHCRHDVPLL